MTSLALAARAAPTPPFNSTFYAIVATIIPVLFLALAVQGPAYQALLERALKAARSASKGHRPRFALAEASASLLALAAYLIVVAGFLGEVAAITTLLANKDNVLFASVAYFSAVSFAAAVAATPSSSSALHTASSGKQDTHRPRSPAGPTLPIPNRAKRTQRAEAAGNLQGG